MVPAILVIILVILAILHEKVGDRDDNETLGPTVQRMLMMMRSQVKNDFFCSENRLAVGERSCQLELESFGHFEPFFTKLLNGR